MTAFSAIHNTITEHCLAVGKQSVLNCTPVQLTLAIIKALEVEIEEMQEASKREEDAFTGLKGNHPMAWKDSDGTH